MKVREEEKMKDVNGKRKPFKRIVCRGHARSVRRNWKCVQCKETATGWVSA